MLLLPALPDLRRDLSHLMVVLYISSVLEGRVRMQGLRAFSVTGNLFSAGCFVGLFLVPGCCFGRFESLPVSVILLLELLCSLYCYSQLFFTVSKSRKVKLGTQVRTGPVLQIGIELSILATEITAVKQRSV
jgi:hypothetical protein